MAVLTVGDVKQQVCDMTGAPITDTIAMRVVLAAMNTAVRRVLGEMQAHGMPYARQYAAPIAITPTTTAIPLFNGTTDTDADGVIRPRCRVVHQVRLDTAIDGIGKYLTHRSLETLRVEQGETWLTTRGTPEYWDVYARDSTGRPLLWLLPLPGVTGNIYLDYTAGGSRLTVDAQALPVDEDDEELIVQLTIANITARAPFDANIIGEAKEQARAFWRLFFANSHGARPPHQAIEHITGMTN